MPIPLFQGFGKVIAFRLKRPKQKGRTQHNSTTTNHEVSHVVATTESGLEASIDLSSARSVGGVSLAREASDMAQVALPFVQAIASAIPLVGAPMQAAISGLLTGLQAIDRRSQNKSDLDALTSRLNRLCLNLCNAPPARDPAEQYRRDSFVRMLQGTSARVATLRERCLASTPVTQAIAGCFMDIDRYLADYLWSFQIQNQHDIHEELTILRRQQEDHKKLLITIQSMIILPQSSMGPSASPGATARGCVTFVDATGHHHDIPMNFCTSYQQLNKTLRVLFERDAIEAQIQRRYIEKGEYDLCIDEGTKVAPLTSRRWSNVEAGTKIVMRVTIKQQTTSLSEVDYKCRFCGVVNYLGVRSVKYKFGGRTVCSTDCRECQRRFQITRAYVPKDRSIRSSNSDANLTTDEETRLIRNFHVQQVKPPPPLLSPLKKWWLYEEEEREFLRLAHETPGISLRTGDVSRAHDDYGTSGIEEIEYDSDEWDGTEDGSEDGTKEGAEDGTEEDSEDGTEEDSEDGTEEDSEDGTEEDSEYWMRGGPKYWMRDVGEDWVRENPEY